MKMPPEVVVRAATRSTLVVTGVPLTPIPSPASNCRFAALTSVAVVPSASAMASAETIWIVWPVLVTSPRVMFPLVFVRSRTVSTPAPPETTSVAMRFWPVTSAVMLLPVASRSARVTVSVSPRIPISPEALAVMATPSAPLLFR